MDDLRDRWNHLYKDHLPSIAKARDPVQKTWPVHLDHCFARIILDNAVGIDKPWMQVVKQPAVKHMSATQLGSAIELGERIATGEVDLVQLNEQSLLLRGKKRKAAKVMDADDTSSKKPRTTATISTFFAPPADSLTRHEAGNVDSAPPQNDRTAKRVSLPPDMAAQLQRIADSNLTPFRKLALAMLCQIPPGRYSTYQAMSDHITATSHKTCARAVGNAMRNNPFAPEVPCHRILAADGSLGGFGGSWGEQGTFASKKHALLHDEGVRFDSKLKVKGPPFREFT
ncbi:hypothetical protein LTR53_008765 [Teratosphaeriaceae sp. CCFEE 6253]|nr:hypothetical protein LTR53_008765 [Teratosphaeriaceae sp. CCFEE 6253]